MCRTETTDSWERSGNRRQSLSQKRRIGTRGGLYETSFGSTLRRHTQEFNSTALYELGSEETTKPT